jgi:hypothetical protein
MTERLLRVTHLSHGDSTNHVLAPPHAARQSTRHPYGAGCSTAQGVARGAHPRREDLIPSASTVQHSLHSCHRGNSLPQSTKRHARYMPLPGYFGSHHVFGTQSNMGIDPSRFHSSLWDVSKAMPSLRAWLPVPKNGNDSCLMAAVD